MRLSVKQLRSLVESTLVEAKKRITLVTVTANEDDGRVVVTMPGLDDTMQSSVIAAFSDRFGDASIVQSRATDGFVVRPRLDDPSDVELYVNEAEEIMSRILGNTYETFWGNGRLRADYGFIVTGRK